MQSREGQHDSSVTRP
nr:unnamed protein product [Callosobruchus chinensis]